MRKLPARASGGNLAGVGADASVRVAPAVARMGSQAAGAAIERFVVWGGWGQENWRAALGLQELRWSERGGGG